MVVGIYGTIHIPINPLADVLHSIATFGMVQFDESFITFLFVHWSADTQLFT